MSLVHTRGSDQERLACQAAAAVTMVKLVSQLKTGGGSSFCRGTWLRSGGFLVQDAVWTKHLQSSAEVPLSKTLNPNAHMGPRDELVTLPEVNPAQPPCDPPTGIKQFCFFCTSRVVKSGSVLVFL